MEVFKKSSRVNVIKCMRDTFIDTYISVNSSLIVYSFIIRSRSYNGPSIIYPIDSELAFAATNGNGSLVRYLVDHGANIHAEDAMALRWAAYKGHDRIVRYLADIGADIHSDGDSAIQWAAYNGHESIVRYLVEMGADIHAEDDGALRWATEQGHESVVRYLAEKMERR